FSEGEFEAAVMNFGILHLARPALALSEARRILRPQGRVGFTAWANPEESVGFKLVLRAIEKNRDPSVQLPQGPPFFLFSDTDECLRALTASGFASPEASKLPMTWMMKSADDVFDAFYKGTVRTGGVLRAQSKTSLDAIRAEIQDTAENYKKDGILQIPMPAVIASAVKPQILGALSLIFY